MNTMSLYIYIYIYIYIYLGPSKGVQVNPQPLNHKASGLRLWPRGLRVSIPRLRLLGGLNN